jgi:hypothetical protein
LRFPYRLVTIFFESAEKIGPQKFLTPRFMYPVGLTLKVEIYNIVYPDVNPGKGNGEYDQMALNFSEVSCHVVTDSKNGFRWYFFTGAA